MSSSQSERLSATSLSNAFFSIWCACRSPWPQHLVFERGYTIRIHEHSTHIRRLGLSDKRAKVASGWKMDATGVRAVCTLLDDRFDHSTTNRLTQHVPIRFEFIGSELKDSFSFKYSANELNQHQCDETKWLPSMTPYASLPDF